MKPSNLTIQMNAIEQYFHAILLFMLHKVVLTLKSVDETSVCDHSNESYSVSITSLVAAILYKLVLHFKPADEIVARFPRNLMIST